MCSTTEFSVLFTHQKRKKNKTWQDGNLKVDRSANKASLYGDEGKLLDTLFIRHEQLYCGKELETDRYLITVEDEKKPDVISDDSTLLHPIRSLNTTQPTTKRKHLGFHPARFIKRDTNASDDQISNNGPPYKKFKLATRMTARPQDTPCDTDVLYRTNISRMNMEDDRSHALHNETATTHDFSQMNRMDFSEFPKNTTFHRNLDLPRKDGDSWHRQDKNTTPSGDMESSVSLGPRQDGAAGVTPSCLTSGQHQLGTNSSVTPKRNALQILALFSTNKQPTTYIPTASAFPDNEEVHSLTEFSRGITYSSNLTKNAEQSMMAPKEEFARVKLVVATNAPATHEISPPLNGATLTTSQQGIDCGDERNSHLNVHSSLILSPDSCVSPTENKDDKVSNNISNVFDYVIPTGVDSLTECSQESKSVVRVDLMVSQQSDPCSWDVQTTAGTLPQVKSELESSGGARCLGYRDEGRKDEIFPQYCEHPMNKFSTKYNYSEAKEAIPCPTRSFDASKVNRQTTSCRSEFSCKLRENLTIEGTSYRRMSRHPGSVFEYTALSSKETHCSTDERSRDPGIQVGDGDDGFRVPGGYECLQVQRASQGIMLPEFYPQKDERIEPIVTTRVVAVESREVGGGYLWRGSLTSDTVQRQYPSVDMVSVSRDGASAHVNHETDEMFWIDSMMTESSHKEFTGSGDTSVASLDASCHQMQAQEVPQWSRESAHRRPVTSGPLEDQCSTMRKSIRIEPVEAEVPTMLAGLDLPSLAAHEVTRLGYEKNGKYAICHPQPLLRDAKEGQDLKHLSNNKSARVGLPNNSVHRNMLNVDTDVFMESFPSTDVSEAQLQKPRHGRPQLHGLVHPTDSLQATGVRRHVGMINPNQTGTAVSGRVSRQHQSLVRAHNASHRFHCHTRFSATIGEHNVTGELFFPSVKDCEGNATPCRHVTIPVSFDDAPHYRQVVKAALREYLNIIIFQLAQRYHSALKKVDVSQYSAHNSGSTDISNGPSCLHGIARLRSVKKEGANKGRLFYCCPETGQSQCKFFKWADEYQPPAVRVGGERNSGNKPRLAVAETINSFFRAQGVQLYCECRLVKKAKGDFARRSTASMGYRYSRRGLRRDGGVKKCLFLELRRKESSATYSKDDIWIVSKSLSFDGSSTFVAKSVYYGPSSAGELEIMPISGYSPSNWHSGEQVHALLACNAGNELTCIDNIEEHVNFQSMPLLDHLLHGNSQEVEQLRRFPSSSYVPPTRSMRDSQVNVPWSDMVRLTDEFIRRHHLNEDQAAALHCCASMFGTMEQNAYCAPLPISLIHGVFGAGKSFLLAVIVLFLVELFKLSDARNAQSGSISSISWKILVSSTTNVAVDRILLGLLELGFDEFVRVGSVRKIAKPVLPYSVHSSGSKTQELKELQDMLKGDLLPEEKILVRKSIEKQKLGENRMRLSKVRVVCVTCAACVFPCMDKMKFPVVLLDECSQMTEPSSLLPMARFQCQKLILVGDPKQLSPTIQGSEAQHGTGLNQTLFDRLIKMGYKPILLRVQYRCHPTISAIANRLFYNNQLIDGVTSADRAPVVDFAPTLCFYNVSRGKEKCDKAGSYYNNEEAKFVVFLIGCLLESGVEPSQMGVVTLYKSQLHTISTHLAASKSAAHSELKAVQISTVDAFQGGEKDIVLLSCVRTQHVGFIDCDRRMNVALTRAKCHLLIIGNLRMLSSNAVWGKVIQHCRDEPRGICLADTFISTFEDQHVGVEPKAQNGKADVDITVIDVTNQVNTPNGHGVDWTSGDTPDTPDDDVVDWTTVDTPDNHVVDLTSGDTPDGHGVDWTSGDTPDGHGVDLTSGDTPDNHEVDWTSGDTPDNHVVHRTSGDTPDNHGIRWTSGDTPDAHRVDWTSGDTPDNHVVHWTSGDTPDNHVVHRTSGDTPDNHGIRWTSGDTPDAHGVDWTSGDTPDDHGVHRTSGDTPDDHGVDWTSGDTPDDHGVDWTSGDTPDNYGVDWTSGDIPGNRGIRWTSGDAPDVHGVEDEDSHAQSAQDRNSDDDLPLFDVLSTI